MVLGSPEKIPEAVAIHGQYLAGAAVDAGPRMRAQVEPVALPGLG